MKFCFLGLGAHDSTFPGCLKQNKNISKVYISYVRILERKVFLNTKIHIVFTFSNKVFKLFKNKFKKSLLVVYIFVMLSSECKPLLFKVLEWLVIAGYQPRIAHGSIPT